MIYNQTAADADADPDADPDGVFYILYFTGFC